MEPEGDCGDLPWDSVLQILQAAGAVGPWSTPTLHSPPQEEDEEEEQQHLPDSADFIEVEAAPVPTEVRTVSIRDRVPHHAASSNTASAAPRATTPHAVALAIQNNPALLAQLSELIAAHTQPSPPQAPAAPVAAPAPVQVDCKECGRSFKSTQGLGGHRKYCKGTIATTATTAAAAAPRAPALKRTRVESAAAEQAEVTATAKNHSFVDEHGVEMHISLVEGGTFMVGLFERHWQWTASIADDRLQFYTQHHLSGPSGGDVMARVSKMCMLDAERAFPGQRIRFTTSEKRRELSPWRPLEDAAKKIVQDNAAAFLAEAFKKGLELQTRK